MGATKFDRANLFYQRQNSHLFIPVIATPQSRYEVQ